MKVKDLGEFGAIELLMEIIKTRRAGPGNAAAHDFRLLVDAGDDTAAWKAGEGTELYTTDTVVEGVHFTRATTPWYDVGWKVMAANVSDIAAMGGLPFYALVTLGLPPDSEVGELESLYQGMLDLSNEHGVMVVGGDIVRSPVVFVTIALTGLCEAAPMLRSTAKVGELVAVTGYLGSSSGGLQLMLEGVARDDMAAQHLKAAHQRPRPRVAEGLVMSKQGVSTAMDISDGLLDDLSKLCRSSGVAGRVDVSKIPVHPMLKEIFAEQHRDLALNGGEDYELIFAASEETMAVVLPALAPTASVIGEIVEGEPGHIELYSSEPGERLPTHRAGWDHFR